MSQIFCLFEIESCVEEGADGLATGRELEDGAGVDAEGELMEEGSIEAFALLLKAKRGLLDDAFRIASIPVSSLFNCCIFDRDLFG